MIARLTKHLVLVLVTCCIGLQVASANSEMTTKAKALVAAGQFDQAISLFETQLDVFKANKRQFKNSELLSVYRKIPLQVLFDKVAGVKHYNSASFILKQAHGLSLKQARHKLANAKLELVTFEKLVTSWLQNNQQRNKKRGVKLLTQVTKLIDKTKLALVNEPEIFEAWVLKQLEQAQNESRIAEYESALMNYGLHTLPQAKHSLTTQFYLAMQDSRIIEDEMRPVAIYFEAADKGYTDSLLTLYRTALKRYFLQSFDAVSFEQVERKTSTEYINSAPILYLAFDRIEEAKQLFQQLN